MINSEALLKQISGTIGKMKVLELTRILKEEQFALRDLIDLTFYPDKNIAFRAAWILENIFLQDPARYEPDLEYLVSKINEVKYESCQRHYAKIIMHISDKKAPRMIQQKLQQLDLEPVVEQCFDWMIDPKVKIAVKVFASEALFNLRHRYPWISEDLSNQLQFLMRNGTAAIQSRGKKLLTELSSDFPSQISYLISHISYLTSKRLAYPPHAAYGLPGGDAAWPGWPTRCCWRRYRKHLSVSLLNYTSAR